MAHAENDIVIERSPHDVYAFLADGLNNPLWRKGVKSIRLREGTAGQLGAVYAQTLTGPGGRAIDGDYRITQADPGRKLEFAVIAGPARPTGRYTLSPEGTGTRLTFALDYAPTGLMRLMKGMIAKTMADEVAQLTKLKHVLES